jgi:DNA-binding MarR family transcriptional regulator
MNKVADAIVHSTGGTTRLIDRPEDSKFVRREHCASDRRSVYVATTDEGNAKIDEAPNENLDFLDILLAERLIAADRESLSGLLTKLNATR